MSDNKFIKHLRGENTAKSVLEIKNQKTPTSFANMPHGTSNANDVYSDHRGNATGVLKGSENWKLDGQDLIETTTVYGDGRDQTSDYEANGNTLWVDATYTFATARRFMPNTKFILKLCGHDLETVFNSTIDFTLIVKIGNGLVSKTFTVTEQAFNFCKEFVIDFGESNSAMLKADAGSSMQVQLLCADANAQAVIYNGMTVLTALQRRVDSETVSSDTQSLDEIEYELASHINDKNNPHEVTKAQVGLGNCDNTSDLDKPISTATQTALDGKVNDTGDTLTGLYKHEYGSRVRFMAANSTVNYTDLFMNSQEFEILFHTSNSIYDGLYGRATNGYVTLYPGTDNQAWLGLGNRRWKKIWATELCPDTTNILTLPNKTGILATKDEVDLAANSGRMITDQGVWYAKMYAATVAPAAADGTNYADFSQVDGQGNPIIVTYNRVNGAWVQDQTITPPAEYDGYVPITSKIWDITEQTGQQGGRILWNHQSKEFTPYPQIISFEDIEITGTSTVIMPNNPGTNQIVNKNYVDTLVSNSIGDATITLTQGGVTKGSFTLNQATDDTIELDQGGNGSGHNIGDTFLTTRTDNELNGAVECNGATYNTTDFTGGASIGQLLSAGKVPYVSLATYATLLSTQGYCDRFGWDGVGTTAFRVPTLDLHHTVVEILEPTSANPYWYRRYADGWVEQGGIYVVSANAANVFVPFPFSMADTNYTLTTTYNQPTAWESNTGNTALNVTCRLAASTNRKVTNGFYFNSVGVDGVYSWRVSGKLSVGSETLYQRAMVQLAVSATDEAVETCTGVLADVATLKSHEVIEFQPPTANNNYTWYRKYADGWVEQGGISNTGSGTSGTITLPITMQDNNYTAIAGNGNNGANNYFTISRPEATTTTIKWYKSSSRMNGYWEVKGMYAQS